MHWESGSHARHWLTDAVAGFTNYNGASELWVVRLGWVALLWYATVTLVCWLGYFQIQTKFRRRPPKAISTTSLHSSQVPHVTILRPVKGIEPYLYECLAASLRQDYPSDKLTVYFCVSSTKDPAYPILQQLLVDFPDVDAKIFTQPPYADHELGPNPKIRNMSRAYRKAKGDIIWIVDCNVWLGKGVCGRMVDRLCGFDPKYNGGRRYKFVHHLPIVVDVNGDATIEDGEPSIPGNDVENLQLRRAPKGIRNSVVSRGGGRLEEVFLASAHAKMYSAINTVLVAPCIVGKSSMFRRSHLDYLTSPAAGAKPYRLPRPPGIDYFSDNICEDHLIGDRLWYGRLPEEVERGEAWGKHSLVFGDIAVQPMSGMGLSAYIDRRIRWLRVRKFTVLLATLVEPGTEAFLCSLYLAFGVTTVPRQYFPAYADYLQTWAAFSTAWLLSILLWIVVDWTVYLRLHSASAIEVDQHTPPFALPHRRGKFARRPFQQWLLAWLGREALALPIWTWAFYCGSTVVWRDRLFRVGMDMVAHEIRPSRDNSIPGPRSLASANDATVGISRGLRRRTPNGSLTKAGGHQQTGRLGRLPSPDIPNEEYT